MVSSSEAETAKQDFKCVQTEARIPLALGAKRPPAPLSGQQRHLGAKAGKPQCLRLDQWFSAFFFFFFFFLGFRDRVFSV